MTKKTERSANKGEGIKVSSPFFNLWNDEPQHEVAFCKNIYIDILHFWFEDLEEITIKQTDSKHYYI